MSIAIMTEVWKTTLPLAKKMVLLALADNANDQGECYPSISMIALKCSLKERAVYGCLKQLEADGLLIRLSRSGRSSVYRITAPPNWPTPIFNAPLHNMHPFPVDKSPSTPASNAPLHNMHPPLHNMQGTPAQYAPITITEPSLNQKRSNAPPVNNFSPVVDAADENPAALLSVATENLVSNLVALGVKVSIADPLSWNWAERGVNDQIARRAVAVARQRKPAGPIPPKYLAPIIEDFLADPDPPERQRGPAGWWNNEAGTLAMGQTLGVIPLRGESMPEFRSRIQIEIEKQKNQAQRRA
jgi:hypothetical protein